MAENLTDIINANLNLIHKSKNQCLQQSNFIDDKGRRLIDSTSIIKKMVEEDLIETEEANDIYFLTEKGYGYVEEGRWSHEDLLEEEEDFEPQNFSLNYERPTYLGSSKAKFWLMLFLVAVAITVYNFYNPQSSNKFPPMSPESSKELQYDLDSLLKVK